MSLIGYRHLPLYDLQGEQFLFSTIFVNVDVKPISIVEKEVPTRASTMDTIKSTAKSVLSRGFSSDRRTVKHKHSQSQPHQEVRHDNKDDKDGKDGGSHPMPILTRKTK